MAILREKVNVEMENISVVLKELEKIKDKPNHWLITYLVSIPHLRWKLILFWLKFPDEKARDMVEEFIQGKRER